MKLSGYLYFSNGPGKLEISGDRPSEFPFRHSDSRAWAEADEMTFQSLNI